MSLVLFDFNKKLKESPMSKIEKVLATGKTHTTLSSSGNTSRGHNGNLDIELSTPGNAKPAHVFAATIKNTDPSLL